MWQTVSDTLFKMTWLNDLAGVLVEKIFKLSLESKLGSSIQFFIFDTIKIFILLSVLIFMMGIIQTFFPPEKTKKVLGGIKGWKGHTLGVLVGIISEIWKIRLVLLKNCHGKIEFILK